MSEESLPLHQTPSWFQAQNAQGRTKEQPQNAARQRLRNCLQLYNTSPVLSWTARSWTRNTAARGKGAVNITLRSPGRKEGAGGNQRFGVTSAAVQAGGVRPALQTGGRPGSQLPRASSTGILPPAHLLWIILTAKVAHGNTRWRDQPPPALTQELSPREFPPAPTRQLPCM